MTLDCHRRHNVNIGGRGHRPIVFAHGIGCDQPMWRFVAHAFEADHRAVLFDHIGCGKSDLLAYDPERTASWQVMPMTGWPCSTRWTCTAWCSSATRSVQ